MPVADVGGIKLYFEEYGPRNGPPVVLIHGLGIPGTLWYHQIPAFSTPYRLIVLDTRGAGRSEQPAQGYSVARMAADVVELLDYVGVDRATVLGLSLGGLVAQELALSFPHRVHGLILACTHAGGPEYLEATGAMWKERLNVAGMSLEEVYRGALEWGATPDFMREQTAEAERFVAARLEWPQSAAGFQGQFVAGAAFDARERLPDIETPTLVIHGTEDEVVPRQFGKYIAERIPGARLHLIKGAGHLPFVERPTAFNDAVLQFLADVNTEGESRP